MGYAISAWPSPITSCGNLDIEKTARAADVIEITEYQYGMTCFLIRSALLECGMVDTKDCFEESQQVFAQMLGWA